MVIFIVATTALSSRTAPGLIFHYFTEQLRQETLQSQECTTPLGQVPVKLRDCLNLSIFFHKHLQKQRVHWSESQDAQSWLPAPCSEWVSWYHSISSPSAPEQIWRLFPSPHLCLWAGSNDCTHRRHLGFFCFGAFMKTSISLAKGSLVILDSSHIVLEIPPDPWCPLGCGVVCAAEGGKPISEWGDRAPAGPERPKNVFITLDVMENTESARVCPFADSTGQ